MVSRWSETVSPAAAISSGVTAAPAPRAPGPAPPPRTHRSFRGGAEASASARGQALHLPPHSAVLLVPQVEQPVDGHIFDRLEVPSQGLAHRRRGGGGILRRAAFRFGDDLVG